MDKTQRMKQRVDDLGKVIKEEYRQFTTKSNSVTGTHYVHKHTDLREIADILLDKAHMDQCSVPTTAIYMKSIGRDGEPKIHVWTPVRFAVPMSHLTPPSARSTPWLPLRG